MTLAEAIERARLVSNDLDPAHYRISPAQALAFANDGLRIAVSIRPDLFLGVRKFDSAWTEFVATDAIPFGGREHAALQMYIAGRMELPNDQAAEGSRANNAMLAFQGALLGV